MRFISSPGLCQPLTGPVSTNLQNEKRKDKEVTARIEHILKLRDQATQGVDMGALIISTLCTLLAMNNPLVCLGKVEQKVDHLVRIRNYTIPRGPECDFC